MQTTELSHGLRVRYDDTNGHEGNADVFEGEIERISDGWLIRVESVEETAIGTSRGDTFTFGADVNTQLLDCLTIIGCNKAYVH